MLTYRSSSLSEMKSTIGTSSLSSELTDVSFADITVSSQESFDNDNIVLPARIHPNISRYLLIFTKKNFYLKIFLFFKKRMSKRLRRNSLCI